MAIKLLPLIFGCHQLPERSFVIKGKQCSLCVRCTGELAGIIIASLTYLWGTPTVPILFLLLLPLILDGGVQLLTTYQSNHFKRMTTGLLFGYAVLTLILLSASHVLEIGTQVGISLKH